MSYVSRVALMFAFVGAGIGATAVQMEAQNEAPNPYRTVPGVWAELPDGRSWGLGVSGTGTPPAALLMDGDNRASQVPGEPWGTLGNPHGRAGP